MISRFKIADMYLPNEVLQYFASDPLSPLFSVEEVADSQEHGLFKAVNSAIAEVPRAAVESVLNDRHFRFLYGDIGEEKLERKARIVAIIEYLDLEIPKRRQALLLRAPSLERPAPYDHLALQDLQVSDDLLVPLSEFHIQAGGLFRKGCGFTILLPVPSTNSGYWFTRALCTEETIKDTQVRLDPLIVRPTDVFPLMSYRMWWYGRELSWERLHNLKDDEHGRWLADRFSSGDIHFTDFVWSPRGSEVHFQCEELPKSDAVEQRGSRYVHAIYKPSTKQFEHLDAAVRIYSASELSARTETHVRNAGKAGVRIKVFQINSTIPSVLFSNIVSSYFVWNIDVLRYFGSTGVSGA